MESADQAIPAVPTTANDAIAMAIAMLRFRDLRGYIAP
jgi:hypothetical protein